MRSALVVLALVSCGGQPVRPASGSPEGRADESSAEAESAAVDEAESAQQGSGPADAEYLEKVITLRGFDHRLKFYLYKPITILVYGASWCGACNDVIESLEELVESKYPDSPDVGALIVLAEDEVSDKYKSVSVPKGVDPDLDVYFALCGSEETDMMAVPLTAVIRTDGIGIQTHFIVGAWSDDEEARLEELVTQALGGDSWAGAGDRCVGQERFPAARAPTL